jgi:hypothetical protein
MQEINNNEGYSPKMDMAVTRAVNDWWNSLSKEELLHYIAEQPTMTADAIRKMMGNMNCVLAFDIKYATRSSEAVADFHTQGDN